MSNSLGFDTYLLPGPHDLFQLLLNDNRDILKKKQKGEPKPTQRAAVGAGNQGGNPTQQHSVGLTVRVEINLPAEGNQETYDRIFKSIRENLLNG